MWIKKKGYFLTPEPQITLKAWFRKVGDSVWMELSSESPLRKGKLNGEEWYAQKVRYLAMWA